ncbi:hypothetical protein KUTeg_007782 [Tegillarca granosa]|uniref:5'-nucleotidase n=1 Tax=Tegillarca granosa TaxID=220873 RepID=A0ABQ9FGH7_TEGGR|nr:hypothetical protein KUTeg_007782 [Tegillarca granosa]
MNQLGYDAMVSSFYYDTQVNDFMKQRLVITNASGEPRLNGKFNKSTILTVGGEKFGIIGYITEETAEISNPGNTLKFNNAIPAIQEEVRKLKAAGVNKIIGLGHYGYGEDQKLARSVTDLDLIVGGHTHTFLYTGTPPSNDVPEGEYPTVVKHEDGTQTLIVQDFWAGKYLGFLNVTFDDNGVVTSYNGDPILLDNSTDKDPGIEAEVVRLKRPLEQKMKQVIGKTAVYLEGASTVCRLRECNLGIDILLYFVGLAVKSFISYERFILSMSGNAITDSMVNFHAGKYDDETTWTEGAVALMNSGGIRAPIEVGNITVGGLLTLMPFGNKVDIITLKGKYLREALEHSVERYSPVNRPGAFLQMSGIHVVYNLCHPPGHRVVSALVRCKNCLIPRYYPLNDDKVYTIILADFIINGGDGFKVFKEHLIKHFPYNALDSDTSTSFVFHEAVMKLPSEHKFTPNFETQLYQYDNEKGLLKEFDNGSDTSAGAGLLGRLPDECRFRASIIGIPCPSAPGESLDYTYLYVTCGSSPYTRAFNESPIIAADYLWTMTIK